jgi:CRISPR system Cascade subunit CasB
MNEKTENFIGQLEKLTREEDRKTLAELRRSLSYEPGQYVRAFPFVERFTSTLEGWPRQAYFLVAGLYANHQESNFQKESLGRTLKRLYFEQDENPSLERRFLTLLESDTDQLPTHLRHLVQLLKAKGFAPHWKSLLEDIQYWHSPDARDRTKRRWAKDFYRPFEKASAKNDSPEDIAPTQEAQGESQ